MGRITTTTFILFWVGYIFGGVMARFVQKLGERPKV